MKSVLRTILPTKTPQPEVTKSDTSFTKVFDFIRHITVRNGATFEQPAGERAISSTLSVDKVEFSIGGDIVKLRVSDSGYFSFMRPLDSDRRMVVIQTPECQRMLIGAEGAYPVWFTLSGVYDEESGHLNLVGTVVAHGANSPVDLTHIHLSYMEA